MKKKATKKSAPAKKAVEPKVKTLKSLVKPLLAVKQEERNQVKDSIPNQPAVKPISKAEMNRRLANAKKQAEEFAKMMEKHKIAAQKKRDEEFKAAFDKAENKLEIYFTKNKDGETMDMKVTGFDSPIDLAGVLSQLLGKVTGR